MVKTRRAASCKLVLHYFRLGRHYFMYNIPDAPPKIDFWWINKVPTNFGWKIEWFGYCCIGVVTKSQTTWQDIHCNKCCRGLGATFCLTILTTSIWRNKAGYYDYFCQNKIRGKVSQKLSKVESRSILRNKAWFGKWRYNEFDSFGWQHVWNWGCAHFGI